MIEAAELPDLEDLFAGFEIAHLDPIAERDEWLEFRHRGIGGSDAAAVFGANPYQSPIDLWLNKTGQVPDEDLSSVEAVYWGNVLESIVADEFARRSGLTVWKPEATIVNPATPWMICNPDRLYVDADGNIGVLEVKTALSRWSGAAWDDDGVPLHYELQVLHYAAVLGLTSAYICVLREGPRFEMQPVNLDPEVMALLVEEERVFWQQYVETRQPPPPDDSDACADALNRLWTPEPGSTIQLGDEAISIVRRYWQADQAIKVAEAAKTAAANELRMLLGDAEVGLVGAAQAATWKKQTTVRAALDAKTVKAHVEYLRGLGFTDAADLHEDRYLNASVTRVLRPSQKYKPDPTEQEPPDAPI